MRPLLLLDARAPKASLIAHRSAEPQVQKAPRRRLLQRVCSCLRPSVALGYTGPWGSVHAYFGDRGAMRRVGRLRVEFGRYHAGLRLAGRLSNIYLPATSA